MVNLKKVGVNKIIGDRNRGVTGKAMDKDPTIKAIIINKVMVTEIGIVGISSIIISIGASSNRVDKLRQVAGRLQTNNNLLGYMSQEWNSKIHKYPFFFFFFFLFFRKKAS